MTQPNDSNNPDRKINSEDFIRHGASCVQQHVVPEALTMYHPSARTVSPRSSSRRTPPSRRRASPLFQRTRRAFGPTGSTTSTCRRGPTRCGRTRRPRPSPNRQFLNRNLQQNRPLIMNQVPTLNTQQHQPILDRAHVGLLCFGDCRCMTIRRTTRSHAGQSMQ